MNNKLKYNMQFFSDTDETVVVDVNLDNMVNDIIKDAPTADLLEEYKKQLAESKLQNETLSKSLSDSQKVNLQLAMNYKGGGETELTFDEIVRKYYFKGE